MAFKEEFYRDPLKGAVQWLTKEEWRLKKKTARLAYREHYGCNGCWFGDEVFKGTLMDPLKGYSMCTIGHKPGPRGFCCHWWSDKSGFPPPKDGENESI